MPKVRLREGDKSLVLVLAAQWVIKSFLGDRKQATMDKVKTDEQFAAKSRPSLLERKLRENGQLVDANSLAHKRNIQKKKNPVGRPRDGIVEKGKQLKDRIDAAIVALEEEPGRDVILEALRKNPLELLKIRASLEPKNLNVEHAIKQVVFVVFEGKPPDDWTPPVLEQVTSDPVLDAIVEQGEEES